MRLRADVFRDIFPFHLLVDRSLTVIQAGKVIQRLVPHLGERPRFSEVVEITLPRNVDDFETIERKAGNDFVLEHIGSPGLRIRCSVFLTEENQALFIGSPILCSLEKLNDLGLKLEDFPPHDQILLHIAALQSQKSAISDATELLKLRAESKQRERKLKDAMAAAEAANRAKSEFLANMSHELRTPLNAIIGFSEIIKEETLGPAGSVKYRAYAKDINESGQHLLDVINDILDLSKIESGAGELQEDDVEILNIVRSILTLVKGRAQKGGVELQLDVADSLPVLRADERKLKQILVNLLSNGIKFTEAGGKVTLRIWWRPDSGYVFQIIDSGIGIALEDIPRALAFFQQVDTGLNRKFEGTGLGLPLAKVLVELHGGSMDLQSHLGVGTTVTVHFPAERTVSVPDSAGQMPYGSTG